MNTTLQKNFILVKVNMTSLSTKKKDNAVTHEIEESKGAKDSGYFYKRLISKEFSDTITKTQGQIRTLLYNYTFSWFSNSFRILSLNEYKKFITELKNLEEKLNDGKKEFFNQYSAMYLDSENRLQSMFNSLEFPTLEYLKAKLSNILQYEFTEIPENNFLVNLEQKEIEQLQEIAKKQAQENMQKVISELWEYVKDILTRFNESLSKEKGRIFDSTVQKVIELAEKIDSYNLDGRTELTKISQKMKRDFKGIENVDLKNDKEKRSEYQKKVEDTLKKINSYM